MALGLLQLCLTLLCVLKTQAHSTDKSLLSPSLSKAPLQPDFQDDKFQGKWHILVWAANTMVNESLSLKNVLSNTFELNDDHSYNVTSIWLSDPGCIIRRDTFIPSGLPSQYIMEDVTGYKGLQNFTMKVVETNYHEYAVVFYEGIVDNKGYMEYVLYGRNRSIKSDLVWNFPEFVMSMDFKTEHIIFTLLRSECNVDHTG